MRKRMVSAALALCLALTLFSGTALAAGEHPFTDVPQGHWAGDAVQYVYENNLMGGTDSTTFSPNNTTTRGMIVTVLYRLTGEPASGTASQFTDVAAGAWYAKAVAWAASRDIVNGTSATTFSPNSPITREQLAVIFYRYAQDQGWDVSAWTDLGLYQDAAQVSDYATQALAWAVGAGLITGTTDTTLSPRGSATRAQVAVILTRFCETVMPDGPVSHQEMVRNIQNSSLRKKDTLAAMAQVLLDDGFAPAFVAGLLGNIIEEGDCGRFESSAYLSNPDAEPDYLVYMDENYDYRDKYSYRLIYEGISLQEVYAMVLELGPEGANGRGSCFGLGCMQWTSYNRIKRLLENYLEAADGADTITLAQVQEAEGITISYELRNTHKKVYTDWQTANPEQDTEEAAYDAGVKVCTSYGIPVGYNTPEVQEKRGLPDGTAVVDDDLDLTAAALRRYGTKLYVLGDVTVSADCIAALGKLEFFHASGTVTLPQEAEETFCAIPDLAYDELRVLSGHLFSGLPKLTLTPDLLAQYPEGIACVDCAMVRLDPALLPDEIAKHCQFDGCALVQCTEVQQNAVAAVSRNVAQIHASQKDGPLSGLFDPDTASMQALQLTL